MGYTIMLENTIMQKDKPATAGSKMLENFISPIDATVATRLEKAGVTIIDSDKHSTAPTETIDAVADSLTDFALFNDYTGVVSHAAAARGICYIHPTYGTVSRYGLIPAVQSMDQIGIVCRTPEEGSKILKIIAGFDPKDGAMLPEVVNRAETFETQEPKEPQETPPIIRTAEITPKYSEIYTQIMQILCCAELSNNISRYDGIKYGYRAKDYQGLRGLYTKTRTEAFEPDIKLAAMIGAMVLSQENYERYYDKAMRLRRLIKESLEFDKYDVLCAPLTQPAALTQPAPLTQTTALTQATPILPLITLSRLCGLPSVTTPEYIYVANTNREDILQAVCKTQTNGGAGI